MIALCFFIPHYANLGIFIYPVVVLLAVWLYLKYTSRENFRDLFFSFKRFESRSLWIGMIAAILLSLFFSYAWDPLINKIIPGKIDLSDFSNIRDSPANYVIILVLALVVGGFYEEIIFHGFIFTRLEKIFKGKKWATAAAFIITNIIFGCYHFQMGIKEILLATIAGAAYHALILRFNRNLWYGLFFHAFFDFIGLTLIYLGYL
jgi:membrane protease YdiL (CAAX protease family)